MEASIDSSLTKVNVATCFDDERFLQPSLDRMDRPLAIGGVSGVASSIILTLLRGLTEPVFEVPAPVTLPLPTFDCPTNINLEELPWTIFLAGVCCGVAIGPTLDLAWVLRQRWRRFIWRVSAAEVQSRPLHKVLA